MKKINYRTKEWQSWKLAKPNVSKNLRSILIGIIISDATVIKHGKYASIKIDQGKSQKLFVEHLLDCLKDYCFEPKINIRYKKELPYSYYFKTFTHPTFLEFYNLFYKEGKKVIPKDFVTNYIDPISLAYWIMGDGSYSKRDGIMYLHTQGFSYEEVLNMSLELNTKFNLHSTLHKEFLKTSQTTSYKIYIPKKDIDTIKNLVSDHMLSIFNYKLGTPLKGGSK